MAKRKKAQAVSTASVDVPESDRWRARDDLRTLTNAAEITKDGKRLKAAHAEAHRQRESLDMVTDTMGRGRGRSRSERQASRRKRLENVAL